MNKGTVIGLIGLGAGLIGYGYFTGVYVAEHMPSNIADRYKYVPAEHFVIEDSADRITYIESVRNPDPKAIPSFMEVECPVDALEFRIKKEQPDILVNVDVDETVTGCKSIGFSGIISNQGWVIPSWNSTIKGTFFDTYFARNSLKLDGNYASIGVIALVPEEEHMYMRSAYEIPTLDGFNVSEYDISKAEVVFYPWVLDRDTYETEYLDPIKLETVIKK